MAKKNFSYNPTFTNTDWDNSGVYTSAIINGIKDPGGGTNTSPANAIPSPFARMDLVRTAFRNASDGLGINDLTDHDFKLISDAWDVGELFFRKKELFGTNSSVKIIEWDKTTRVNALKNSQKEGHQKLGKALELYLDQDAVGFNFALQPKYYLFQRDFVTYGGTSPITLFFSSADKLPQDINIEGDVLFDEGVGNWKHLHERGEDFQEFIHLLFETGNFRSNMPAMDDYLVTSHNLLAESNRNLYDTISRIRANGTPIEITDGIDGSKKELATGYLDANFNLQAEGQLQVKIFDSPLYTPKASREPVSDFILDSKKIELKVLVPPNEDAKISINDAGLKYFGGEWQSAYRSRIPYKSDENWRDRKVPATTGRKSAVLLLGDILDDVILKVNYPINQDGFLSMYEGHTPQRPFDYLLPLKKEFFNFFDHDFLKSQISGKKVVELEEFGDGKAVKLYVRIPIKNSKSNTSNGYVEFSKIYSNKVDSERNKGKIVALGERGFDVGLVMTPAVKWDVKPDYRVQLLDVNTEKHLGEIEIKFYSNTDDEVLSVRKSVRRSKAQGGTSSKYYNVRHAFDWIDFTFNIGGKVHEAKVIPLWHPMNSNVRYDVAIDFGTTNTHVEIRSQNDADSAELKFVQAKSISSLFDLERGKVSARDLITLMDQEFIPDKIGEDTYKFPKRTVVAHSGNYSPTSNKDSFALGDYNYPFVYEVKPLHLTTEVQTNLKWSFDPGVIKLLNGFIENIALLIRSKILSENGDPKQTKFYFTYPTSMTEARVSQMEASWRKCIVELFGIDNADDHPTSLSESLAPYVYYSKKNQIAAFDRPVISIDIGGGTTDIIVTEGKSPAIVTSLKFAGNSIFGDGYNSNVQANGFLNRYLEGVNHPNAYRNQLDTGAIAQVLKALSKKPSTDIVSFLFSLKNSKELAEKKIAIDFANDLSKDVHLRTTFVIFFSSVVFHVARQMQQKGLRPAKDILFSGTGSLLLNLMDPQTDHRHLNILAKEIFKSVFESDVVDVSIKLDPNPKQLTAKGAILFDKNEFIGEFQKKNSDLNSVPSIMKALTHVYVGSENGTAKEGRDYTYENLESSGYENFVKAEFDAFIDCLELLYKNQIVVDQFEIEVQDWNKAIEILNKNFVDGLAEGMRQKKKEVNDQGTSLTEPPFFYPLHYSLCGIANELTK